MRKAATGIALLLCSLVVAVGGFEVLLRRYRPVYFLAPVGNRSADTWSGLVHRASAVPGLAYELAPDRAQETAHGFVRTNSYGMRDDELLPAGTPDLLRIAAVGDSYTFGFGVESADAYPDVVERLLAERRSPRPVEVMNFGVGGYSSADEALVVRHKVLDLQPRLILVGYVLNDPEVLPVQPLQRYFTSDTWYHKLHTTRLVMQARRAWRISYHGGGDYVRHLHAGPAWKTVEAAFADISRATTSMSVPVIVVIFPLFPETDWKTYAYEPIHSQVAAAARAAGLDVLDLLDEYRAYRPEVLRVEPGNWHPSVLGHRIAAEAIVKKLGRDYAELIR